MHNIIKYYKSVAGFQFWDHINYKGYKCRGPYIAHWGKHVAPWNPSVLGHHLRGAHHAYFWLSIWRDSLAEIRQRLKSSENLSTQRLHDGEVYSLYIAVDMMLRRVRLKVRGLQECAFCAS